jgi:cobalamin synthase
MGFVRTAPARLLGDVAENLRFFTRLPLGRATCAPDFRRIGWAAPLAGAGVGAIGALGLVGARALGFPSLLSATLAVILQIIATGALHEDGLADVADGFGGGRDRAAKLEILRDSRIGTYGALALGLSILVRVEAVAALSRPSTGFAAAGLVLAGAAARGAALGPLAWLPAARSDGLGAGAAALGVRTLGPVTATLSSLWRSCARCSPARSPRASRAFSSKSRAARSAARPAMSAAPRRRSARLRRCFRFSSAAGTLRVSP